MDVNVKIINGNWHAGYTLDKHVKSSVFIGDNQYGHPDFDTVRTDVGEAMYQLKYKNDRKKIPLLVDAFIENLKSKLSSVGFIVPMPPSKRRVFQPLTELAKEIAKKMDVPLCENILIKKVRTPQMKDIESIKEKIKVLATAFSIKDEIVGEDCWDVLLIDDIYGSGTSLNDTALTLKTYSKVNNIYVVAFTRKR